MSDIITDKDDFVSRVTVQDSKLMNMSRHARKRLLRGDSLGPSGQKFSDAVYDFVFEEGMNFVKKRSSIMDMA